MTQLHIVLTTSLEEDLLPLATLLRSRGLPHKVYEEDGQQVLAVYDAAHVAPVRELYRAWRAGEVRIEMRGERAVDRRPLVQWRQARQAPVTAAVIALCVAVYVATLFLPWLRPQLTFLPYHLQPGGVSFGSMNGEYWRLVTPVLLHFGLLHIAFNLLWFWVFGAPLERVLGKFNYLGVLLVIAVSSNFSQFLASGPGPFGGMSGVVYGVLGFAAVAPVLQPAWPIRVPTTVVVFMLGWLLVCMTGVLEVLGFGAIANAAHFSGLVAGALLGAVFGGLSRLERSAGG
ncbi:rhomboid family intramembrane serine protease [Mangrovimicrobium sediminis]|uniref:Rhomboid family intramembrane serine protease n=1 Tax=Mangrovimicrobium sediminis TaxID=2562682 RepID=A0A4Z0M5J4_9GAMM|nr:rhomboid family intramembrane serine protease [Haliea sp. SAOS-164]TGD74771.1 rhomboid family intramembrane serine protease [Haliea sp. SAOS-164]